MVIDGLDEVGEEYEEEEDDGTEEHDIDEMFPDRDNMLQFLVKQHSVKWSNQFSHGKLLGVSGVRGS